ncbi:MAG: DUF2797 domain-containing protein [Flavobacteriaceae bacterium]
MFEGTLKKMLTEMQAPIRYFLDLDTDFVDMNQCLEHTVSIEMIGTQCLSCKADKPIFRQGFCQSCFFESPQAGEWIMRPELSTAHLDIEDRDLAYERKIQLQPHIVYLAMSSHLKVGITRKSQVPTRWIDQGAHLALSLLEVPNRYLAGVGEVALKNLFSDKTNWRKMLQNDHDQIDWTAARQKAINALPEELKPYVQSETRPTALHFPVNQYPQKVNSLNLSKTPSYQGVLKGIKGQYLIFGDQTVFNVRSNEGYRVRLTLQ